jgi:hypothetical protein
MIPHTPSKLAPAGTPECVAHFLDHAAQHLGQVVEKGVLELKPYDLSSPEEGTWAHHLYGKVWERDFAIQIAANDRDSPAFHSTISCFIKLVVTSDDPWMRVDCRHAIGMDGLLKCVKDLVLVARIVCALRMPHVCEPDAKA